MTRSLRQLLQGVIYISKTDSRASQIADSVQKETDNLFDLKTSLAKQSSDTNTSTANTATITMIIVVIAGIVIAIGLGIFISRIISKPVNNMLETANKIADGDFDMDIEVTSKDELGKLSGAFKKMVDNLNDVLANINASSEQVAAGSKQVSDSSIALSQGATEQASSIEQLTASLEEISSQTKLNAENANQANELAENAKSNAVEGNTQMKEMLKAMEEIKGNGGQIYSQTKY